MRHEFPRVSITATGQAHIQLFSTVFCSVSRNSAHLSHKSKKPILNPPTRHLRNLSCSTVALCASLAGTFSENTFHVKGAAAFASACCFHCDSTLHRESRGDRICDATGEISVSSWWFFGLGRLAGQGKNSVHRLKIGHSI